MCISINIQYCFIDRSTQIISLAKFTSLNTSIMSRHCYCIVVDVCTCTPVIMLQGTVLSEQFCMHCSCIILVNNLSNSGSSL